MVEKNETMTKKRLNLQQLIREGKPIWVLNKSGEYSRKRGRKAKSGIIVMQIGTADNRDKVVVPPGPDPVCITDQVDSESLKTCRDLLKLWNAQVIELLDPEYAEDYYSRNEARRTLMENKVEKAKFNVKEELLGSDKPDPVKETTVEVDPLLIGLMLKLKHEKITVSEVLERLNENFGNFSSDDIEYLARTSSVPEIKDWAMSQLEISDRK